MPPLDAEQYRLLVEQSPAMIWRTQRDGRCTYFNATWLAFTGRSLEQEAGHGWIDGVHSEDVNDWRAVFAEHLVRRTPFTRTSSWTRTLGWSIEELMARLMMPEMSGMEFHAELTRRFPHFAARVVFVSGGAFTASAQAFLEQVENERLDKPFAPASVRGIVQRMLASDR